MPCRLHLPFSKNKREAHSSSAPFSHSSHHPILHPFAPHIQHLKQLFCAASGNPAGLISHALTNRINALFLSGSGICSPVLSFPAARTQSTITRLKPPSKQAQENQRLHCQQHWQQNYSQHDSAYLHSLFPPLYLPFLIPIVAHFFISCKDTTPKPQRTQPRQQLVYFLPDFLLRRSNFLNICIINAPCFVCAFGNLVDVAVIPPQHRHCFPQFRQIKFDRIPINRHLAQVCLHVPYTHQLHLLTDQSSSPAHQHGK